MSDGAATYNHAFFDMEARSSVRSAPRIVERVVSLLRPESLVDVGCGIGAFLNEALLRGVKEVRGVEEEWVLRYISPEAANRVEFMDLRNPRRLTRRFDVAFCLEVGEHLPGSAAQRLVDYCSSLSDLVLFSAAVPGQGGHGHLNEQWPNYWAKKFKSRGYVAVDCFRQALCVDPEVAQHYKQNTLLYADPTGLGRVPIEVVRNSLVSGRVGLHVCSPDHPMLSMSLNLAPQRLRETGYFYAKALQAFRHQGTVTGLLTQGGSDRE